MEVHAACWHSPSMATDDTHPKAIGRRLTATRLALDHTNAAEFAELVGLTPQALNNYETGIRRPNVDQAVKIVQATGVTLDWIYLGDRSGLPHRIASRLAPEQEDRRAS